MTPLSTFHPAVARWFGRTFPAPTPAQLAAWPPIQAGRHTLVAAPTGSGKTLTAFLAALDGLVRQGLRPEGLPDETVVVYVSPLKALSNDIRLNLEAPLAGIRAELAALGLPDVEIRTAVRTGDTPAHERQRAMRKPAAHPRHDARVAVRPARLGARPHDARDRAHGHRRRDPRGRRQQARQPPRAVARAPRRADAGDAHAVGAAPHGSGASACRRRRSRSTRSPASWSARRPDRRRRRLRDRRHRLRQDRATWRSSCRRRRCRR